MATGANLQPAGAEQRLAALRIQSPSPPQPFGALRLGVSIATTGDVRDQPKVADAAPELLEKVFGNDKSPSRLVFGASLPLGVPVEIEVIFEVQNKK